VIALDSSVVVAAFAPWHEHHQRARDVVRTSPLLPAHVALEAYSVLTRLPDPFRAEPQLVADFLSRTFAESRLVLDSTAQAALPVQLAGLGISGGAVWDALICLTAASCGADLVTLDRRAQPTYERCGVPVRFLA
jgi:predicted nucleic acid-binding protein